MNKKAGAQLVALLIPLALLSMGTSKNRTSDEAGVASDPLAGAGAALVGEWMGPYTSLEVHPDRSMVYVFNGDGGKVKHTGTLKAVTANTIVYREVLEHTLSLDKMPAEVDGYTVMTVDGHEVFKGGLSGSTAAQIERDFKHEGFEKTECPPNVTQSMATFECAATVTNASPLADGGTHKTIKVMVKQNPNGFDQDYSIETPGLKREAIVADIPKTLPRFGNVDCGTEPSLWIDTDNVDAFYCRAIDVKTKKPYSVRITRKGDDINYHAAEIK